MVFRSIFSIVSIQIEKEIHTPRGKRLNDACRVESIALFNKMSSMISHFLWFLLYNVLLFVMIQELKPQNT